MGENMARGEAQMEDEELLKQFDSLYSSDIMKKININHMPGLTAIFKGLGDSLYIQDENYQELRKQKIELESKLFQTISQDEKKVYTDIIDIQNKMDGNIELKLFKLGFLIAKQLEFETN